MSEIVLFNSLAAAGFVGVPAYAWRYRSRPFALFTLVILAIALPGAALTYWRLLALLPAALAPWLHLAFLWGLVASFAQLSHLVRAQLRGRLFRALVSVPGQTFVAAGALSSVWLLAMLLPRAILQALGLESTLSALAWLDLAPPLLALVSVATSVGARREIVEIELGRSGPEDVTRVFVQRRASGASPPSGQRPLRVVQIADPHLGPWRSVRRLSHQIEQLLAHDPDLVLLTGDYLTMEGMGSAGALAEAFAPLRRFEGRSFAIFGDHDHEAPEEVRSALAHNRIRLLMDERVTVDTPAGRVEILGADYVGRGRREHLDALLARFPRGEDLRVMLLHDPAAFRLLPAGAADLTLSGHTHGGQVGLVSLGLDWTALSGTQWPDHGLFARGSNRLYVHRGTGFYGFPLRLGVPGEASLLEIYRAPDC